MTSRLGLRKTIEKHEKQKAQEKQQDEMKFWQTNVGSNVKRNVIKVKPKEIKNSKETITPSREKSINPSKQNVTFPKEHQRPPQKQKQFEEAYKRFTNYLKIEYFNVIHDLKSQGEIDTMTSFLNDAVHEYLAKYFTDKL